MNRPSGPSVRTDCPDENVDGLVVRIGDHGTLERFAAAAEVPVVNALSDRAHPCEALADLYFMLSRFETLDGLPVTWVGDCTNVARSVVSVCVISGAEVRLACPPAYRFDDRTTAEIRSLGPGSLQFFEDPVGAVEGTSAIYTDRWVSMGQEAERDERLAAFAAYQVNGALLSHAPRAVVMHCLPAARGEEITADVLEGDRSVVWQQARTRLPMQQAILEYVCGEGGDPRLGASRPTTDRVRSSRQESPRAPRDEATSYPGCRSESGSRRPSHRRSRRS